MRNVIALRAAHTVAPGDHIYNSIVSFEMSPGPLPVGTMRVSGGGWFIASAVFLSLSSFENYMLVIFVVDISTLTLILLIYDFCS
jgi:hypothetical protein